MPNDKTDFLAVSVITVVRDGEKSIASCLESIVKQGYPRTEVIIIDGGSTDGTLEVGGRYKPYIAYFESGLDTGITNAFNRGIARASGDIIAILNADDHWADGALDKVVEAYLKNPSADVLYGSVIYEDVESGRSYRKDPRLDRMQFRMNLYHPATFITRRTYEAIGLYDETYRLAMDCEWLHRAMANKCKFIQIEGVLAHMALGGVSDRRYVGALREYRRSIVEHGLGSPFRAAMYFYWLLLCKSLFRLPLLRSILRLKNGAIQRDKASPDIL